MHKRRMVLAAGILLPLCEGLGAVISVQTQDAEFGTAIAKSGAGTFLGFYWHSLALIGHKSMLDTIGLVAAFACTILMHPIAFGIGILDGDNYNVHNLQTFMYMVQLFAVVLPTFGTILAFAVANATPKMRMHKTISIFRPCAPQRIAEVDQTFALSVAIDLVLYEHESHLRPWLMDIGHMLRSKASHAWYGDENERLRLLEEYNLRRLQIGRVVGPTELEARTSRSPSEFESPYSEPWHIEEGPLVHPA